MDLSAQAIISPLLKFLHSNLYMNRGTACKSHRKLQKSQKVTATKSDLEQSVRQNQGSVHPTEL